MADLVEFLRARLDEDERDAIDWHFDAGIARGWESLKDRVLAEVEAKRRIIERWEHATRDPDDFEEQWGLEWAMRALAHPYADHPDLDPEWKLDGGK
jgi:hypothetical protein